MAKPTRMELLLAAIGQRLSEVEIKDGQAQQISKKSIQVAILENYEAEWVPVSSAWVRAWHIVMDRMRRASAAEESINFGKDGKRTRSSRMITILDSAKFTSVAKAISQGLPEFAWQAQPQSMLERLEAAIILDLATKRDDPLFFTEAVEERVHYQYRMAYNIRIFSRAWLNVATQLKALGLLLAVGSMDVQVVGKYIVRPQFLVIKDFDQLALYIDDPLSLFSKPKIQLDETLDVLPADGIDSSKRAAQVRKRAQIFGYVRLSKKISDVHALLLLLYHAGATEIFVDDAALAPKWDHLMDQVQPGDLVIVLGLQYFSKHGKQSEQVLYQLLDRGVSLYVVDVGYLIHFQSGVLIRESHAMLNLYRAMLASMPEVMEELALEKIRHFKNEHR